MKKIYKIYYRVEMETTMGTFYPIVSLLCTEYDLPEDQARKHIVTEMGSITNVVKSIELEKVVEQNLYSPINE